MNTQTPKIIKLSHKYEPLFCYEEGKRYTIITGGRGSGKSYALSLFLCNEMRDAGLKVLFTRYTLTSAQDSIIPEFLEKIELLQVPQEFETTKAAIVHKRSKSEILFRGIKTSEGVQTAKLKSIQGVNAWVLDEAEELPDEDLFDKIDLSVRDSRRPNRIILCLNPVHKSHWIYERFFKELRSDCTYIHTDYRDNAPNLPKDYIARAEECRIANPRKYASIWLGEWLEEVEGALWTYQMIQPWRFVAGDVPAMRRVVVAVDPAVTAAETSDETGIIVVGQGSDQRYYVLDDLTMKGSPAAWASAAVGAYHRYKADRIVAEVNQGGDMVEATLRNVEQFVPYTAVSASRGKIVRAEPIAALYERGLVSHVGTMRELEAELTTYAGRDNERSPNRLDALVWALTELTRNQVRPFEVFSEPAPVSPSSRPQRFEVF